MNISNSNNVDYTTWSFLSVMKAFEHFAEHNTKIPSNLAIEIVNRCKDKYRFDTLFENHFNWYKLYVEGVEG